MFTKSSLYSRFGLTLLVSLGFALSSTVQAATTQSSQNQSDTSVIAAVTPYVLFEPPNDDKVDNSRGGASRPVEQKCIQDESSALPLTALIPQSGVGLTVAAHPTLLVYVPPTVATQAHLTLRDANHTGLYQGQVQIPQTGGILSIALPIDSPELAVEETYHWSLALLCQPTQTDIPITSGQIRRVELSDAVPERSLLSQAVTYGRSGVWHDMLVNLALLKQTEPDNPSLNANWIEVLQSENLGAIANTPLLD
ncbi:MAG: DUF928 domain-containing protein [Cyanobacteria bacterium P01_H01_bin.105]